MDTKTKIELFELSIKKVPNNISLENMNLTNDYIELFIKEFPLDDFEKNTFFNLISTLLDKKHSIKDVIYFIPFILPIEQITKGILIHEKIIKNLKNQNKTKTKDIILSALHTGEIPETIIEFIDRNPNSKETFLFIVSFSYLMSENKHLFKKHRNFILEKFKNNFGSVNVCLPYNLFVTNDIDSLRAYQKIESSLATNPLLRLAFKITVSENCISLKDFLNKIRENYEEILDTFSSLKEKIHVKVE